jgi:hypothetical protein
MDDEKQPMPVVEKTAATPPPLPQGSIVGTEQLAPKPAPAPVSAAAVVSAQVTAAVTASQALAKQIQALPNQSRNIQQALRMANDCTGLLQKG